MRDVAGRACLSTESLARLFESNEGVLMPVDVERHVDVCAKCRHLVARVVLARTSTASSLEGEAPPPLPRGAQIGKYVVLSVAGAGAMGIVYAAYDEELDRKVAIKLLHATTPSRALSTSALREAQAMARVTHANVVTVYEVGEHRGQIFLAMEFVEGMTLRRWQSEGRRTWEELMEVYLGAGEGLFAAHRAGLVHRDFKPDNVLVGADGRARVADFGLARFEPLAQAPEAPTPHRGIHVSVSGLILGTPAYMSPEQLNGAPADARSDQFSFCVALYEALYGQPPFAGTSISDLARNIGSAEVRPPPPTSLVPPPIFSNLQRGLRADPAQRFPSMRELVERLSLDPRRDPSAPSVATRLRLLGSLLLVLVGTTVLSNLLRENQPIEVARLFQLAWMQLALVACVALALYRRLAWNVVHWGLIRLALLVAVQMVVLRWVAMRADLELRWVFALDHLVFSTGLAFAAVAYVPRFWIAALLSLATAIGLGLTSEFPLLLAQLAYPLATAVGFGAWYLSSTSTKVPSSGSLRTREAAPLASVGDR